MKEKYLPIGTVVTLKGATKKIMIIGYCPMTKENQVYDYNACLFPEGILSQDRTLVFNHDQIGEINSMGLEDDEQKNFSNKIKEMVQGITNLKKVELPSADMGQNKKTEEVLDMKDTNINNIQGDPTVKALNSIEDIMNS